ncbi:MAG TPA: lysylphosphatidylglycerol synthase transmembrane domain-containing protein [Halanaerobiales bacterium]|nr:lysylphosphatidylglycerol synthase transmembrane domain-containing protein [Halanaerobiales bacterium]
MQSQESRIDRQTVFKGLRMAVILSLIISAIIIIITIDENTLERVIKNMDLKYLWIIMGLILLNITAAGQRLKVMISSVDKKLSLKDCMIIHISGAFVSNVTPFASGGGPFQIYFLHKKGVNVGKASTAVVTNFLLRLFYFGTLTPIFLIFFNQYISAGVVPDYLFYLAFGMGVLISIGIILLTLIPKIGDKLTDYILHINKINNFIKNSYRAKRWLVKSRRELRDFRRSFGVLRKNKKGLFWGAFYTIVFWSSLFMIMPVVLMSFGAEPHFLQAYIMQTIFYLMLPYSPTPGASGVAELGFASLFVAFIPSDIVGLVTFGWRLFTFYTILVIGGIFALREISKRRNNNE